MVSSLFSSGAVSHQSFQIQRLSGLSRRAGSYSTQSVRRMGECSWARSGQRSLGLMEQIVVGIQEQMVGKLTSGAACLWWSHSLGPLVLEVQQRGSSPRLLFVIHLLLWFSAVVSVQFYWATVFMCFFSHIILLARSHQAVQKVS